MTKRLMTAEELKLSQSQYCGLVKTLEALESGKLDHENEHTKGFDMRTWGGTCGSVCCLGGTAEAFGADYGSHLWGKKHATHMVSSELAKLFFPDHHSHLMDTGPRAFAYKASTKQAAVALRHYLMTGKENWKMAMETPR